MADDEEKKRKQAEIERKRAEVRARMEEASKAKKAKKGFMTPERKKKLRLLLRKKAAEELKKEQERKAAERRRIIEERCGKPKILEDANEEQIKGYCKLYHERIRGLEEKKYDLEYLVRLKDIEISDLNSQVNDLRATNLQLANGCNKILVASLKREIFCIEFQENSSVAPTAKEVSFTYIPSGAEIISLDAFNKSTNKNEFVIGITIVKNNNNLDSLEFYLNIYSEWEESIDFNIENIAQNCLILELNFTPYHLTHTKLIAWNDNEMFNETVFLLSGSDNQIHVYREQTIDHNYKEIDCKEYFPEMIKTPTPIVWIDIYNNKDYTERFMAVVCECGYVRLTKVCTKTNKLLFNFSTKLSNCLSNVQIFDNYNPEFTLNLLVVGTILPPVLFEDITTYGLSKYTSLPRHDYTCVLTSCLVVDFDFDGDKEILIGSSAEEIILYKKDVEKGDWCLEEIKLFPSPIIKLHFIDIIADGVKELIVLSMKGVHFLQFNFKILDDILKERLNSFECKKIDEILR